VPVPFVIVPDIDRFPYDLVQPASAGFFLVRPAWARDAGKYAPRRLSPVRVRTPGRRATVSRRMQHTARNV
jgi:hypothetical protein